MGSSPQRRMQAGATALLAALALTVVAGTPATAAPKPPADAATLTDCPASPAPGGGGPPPGAPKPQLLVPVDTSTSTVLDPGTEPQIQCGRVPLRTVTDVLYATPTKADGTPRPLRMDIQIPPGDRPKPVVLYLPGGGFASAAKEQALPSRTFLAEAGFVVASIQYRTVPDGATYTDGIADVQAAIRFLQSNAAQYSIDERKVGLWGASAGAYLASIVGTKDAPAAVKAVVEYFGAADLSKLLADFDPATQMALAGLNNSIALYVNGPGSGKSLADSPEAVEAANPITYISADDPAFLHFHGTEDRTISPSETLTLHNALLAGHVDSTRFVVQGGGHGELEMRNNPAAALPWTTQEIMQVMVDFLRSNLC